MSKFLHILAASAIATLGILPAHSQGIERGAREGAAVGERAGGPVGGAVGGVVGGAVGGAAGAVKGVFGVDQRPRFREYVVREQRPSYTYREQVSVGTVLPESGVTYYDIPSEYGVSGYRYTVVNKHPVIVESRTRRVVEIID